MPTVQDLGTKASSQAFFEDFLNCGGLSAVVNVLQPESLQQDTNYSTRQGCYSVCLQLARSVYLTHLTVLIQYAQVRVSTLIYT